MSGLPDIRTRLGRFGEEVAAGFITRRGGIIVGRNLRVGHNEIDVLAEIEGERVVIEVKTAASWHRAGDAGSNFDDAQAHRVCDAAGRFNPRLPGSTSSA